MPFEIRKSPTDKSLFFLIGFLLLFFASFILIKIYFPSARAEVVYQLSKSFPSEKEIKPVNTDFSIVIPKIKVNANVVKNVDPFDSRIYQKALTEGVAHAKGSGLPGFPGNTFIFAHSAINWYQASQYNSIFYLTNKLEPGDEIFIYYKGSKYRYSVTEKKIVAANEISYLSDSQNATTQSTSSLTLMTCWPPGTDLNRLIILAK
ncbi:MAG: sortase [Candidatus Shapirobacteria bacterium]|nr:sortase [Candidatus Shapirobacteria bacterium]